MRVYVPTTPAALPRLREAGLAAGTEGYAVTQALADALGVGPVAAAGDQGADADDRSDEDLGEAVLDTAAEASLLLLAEELAEKPADEPAGEPAEEPAEEPAGEPAAGPPGGQGTTGTAAARRVVVVVEARARPVEDAEHPATVVLTAPLRWAAVECLLADDERAAGRVGRAAVLARTDQDRAVDRLERDQLGWFGPDELL